MVHRRSRNYICWVKTKSNNNNFFNSVYFYCFLLIFKINDLLFCSFSGLATGIYTTNSPEACQYCAEHSKANIIVVEDRKQLEKILQIKKNLPNLKAIIQYSGIPTDKDVLSVRI